MNAESGRIWDEAHLDFSGNLLMCSWSWRCCYGNKINSCPVDWKAMKSMWLVTHVLTKLAVLLASDVKIACMHFDAGKLSPQLLKFNCLQENYDPISGTHIYEPYFYG
jgi:hypothetical protein